MDDAADDADNDFYVPNLPPNAHLLPPIAHLNEGAVIGDTVIIHVRKIERILNVSEKLRCYAIVFYNELIPQADGAGESYKLIRRRTGPTELGEMGKLCYLLLAV